MKFSKIVSNVVFTKAPCTLVFNIVIANGTIFIANKSAKLSLVLFLIQYTTD